MLSDLLNLMTGEFEKGEFPGIWRWEGLEFWSISTGGLTALLAPKKALTSGVGFTEDSLEVLGERLAPPNPTTSLCAAVLRHELLTRGGRVMMFYAVFVTCFFFFFLVGLGLHCCARAFL